MRGMEKEEREAMRKEQEAGSRLDLLRDNLLQDYDKNKETRPVSTGRSHAALAALTALRGSALMAAAQSTWGNTKGGRSRVRASTRLA